MTADLTEEQLLRLKTRKVVIFTPFYMSQGNSQYFSCLLNTIRVLDRMGIECDTLFINGDSYIDRARNTAVSKFLTDFPTYTHLVSIDSDMEWDVLGFLRLISSPYDFTGAAYPMKNQWDNYCVRHFVNEDKTPKMAEEGLIEAELVPGGFTCISRLALGAMTEEYSSREFANNSNFHQGNSVALYESVIDDGIRYGEDTEFCRKWLRLKQKIYCEPRITFSHYGVHSWSGNYHEFLMAQPKAR